MGFVRSLLRWGVVDLPFPLIPERAQVWGGGHLPPPVHLERVKRFGPSKLPPEFGPKVLRRFSREELRAFFADDPYLSNYVVNLWEAATRQTVLTTYPWKVAIPISDVCNATCTFCNSWL